jgi:uncharacterized protein DUF3592
MQSTPIQIGVIVEVILGRRSKEKLTCLLGKERRAMTSLIGILVAFGSLFLILILAAIYGNLRKQRIHKKRVLVEGRVVDRQRGGGRSMDYWLDYSYHYNGKIYVGSLSVTKDAYDTWHYGAKVPVRCLPEHPGTSQVELTSSERPWG